MTDALTDSVAFAGHAGETGSPLMPHEIMGGITLLTLLVLLLAILSALMFRRLRRLERRLRAVENALKGDGPSVSPRPPD